MSGIGINTSSLPGIPATGAAVSPPALAQQPDMQATLTQLVATLTQLTGVLQAYLATTPGALGSGATAPTPSAPGQAQAGAGQLGQPAPAGGTPGTPAAPVSAPLPAAPPVSAPPAPTDVAAQGGGPAAASSGCGCGGASVPPAELTAPPAEPTAQSPVQQLPMAAPVRAKRTARKKQPSRPRTPEETKKAVAWAAKQYGVKPALLLKIAELESNFRPDAANGWDSNARKGTPSKGVMQFIEPTFKSMAPKARKANPEAWKGVPMDWMDPRAQALTAAWAIKTNQGSHWATYGRARAATGG